MLVMSSIPEKKSVTKLFQHILNFNLEHKGTKAKMSLNVRGIGVKRMQMFMSADKLFFLRYSNDII